LLIHLLNLKEGQGFPAFKWKERNYKSEEGLWNETSKGKKGILKNLLLMRTAKVTYFYHVNITLTLPSRTSWSHLSPH